MFRAPYAYHHPLLGVFAPGIVCCMPLALRNLGPPHAPPFNTGLGDVFQVHKPTRILRLSDVTNVWVVKV